MTLIKNHWLAISLAAALGIVAFLPNVIMQAKLQQEGSTYYPLTTHGYFDEMIFYAPFVKEVIEGNWINDDLALVEHLDTPGLFPILPPILLRSIFFFTNSVTKIFVWNDLLLPPISFLIIYLLGYQISRNKLFSAFFSFSVVGISIIGDVLPLEKLWLHGWQEFLSSAQPMYIARTYNYAVTFIGFALAILFLYRLLSQNRFRDKIAATISCGLLIHLNYFYGAYVAIGLAFILALLFLKKDWGAAKNILFVLIGMEIMAIPYLFQVTLFRISTPHWFEALIRQETDIGRHFYLNIYKHYLLYIGLAVILFLVGKKVKQTNPALLFVGLLLAGLVGLNLQVILGYSLMPNHWLRVNVFGLKFAALAIIWWAKDFWWLSKKYFNYLVAFGLASFLIISSLNQIAYGLNNYPLFTLPDHLIKSLEWLAKNTPKNSVVMTPSTVTSHYFLVYANNKLFMGSSYHSTASNTELEERMLLTHKVFGVDPQYILDAFDPGNLKSRNPHEMGFRYTPSLIEYIYNNQYLDISIDPRYNKPPMPLTVKEHLTKEYKELKTSLADIKNKYQLDYVYVGPLEKEITQTDFDKLKELTKVYDAEGVRIYKVSN